MEKVGGCWAGAVVVGAAGCKPAAQPRLPVSMQNEMLIISVLCSLLIVTFPGPACFPLLTTAGGRQEARERGGGGGQHRGHRRPQVFWHCRGGLQVL